MAPVKEHRKLAESVEVRVCLVITSDSVFEGRKPDELTPLVRKYIEEAGLDLRSSKVVPNDPNRIREAISEAISKCDAVIITGGTGFSRKDISVDVVNQFCVKLIPGFGELFRYLTFMRWGSAAMLSRAQACVTGRSVIFAVPGSPEAVEMALKELIVKELRHLIFELTK